MSKSIDTRRLNEVYQTSQAWAELGTECHPLPFAKIVTHPAFPDHHEGNCIWNVRLNNDSAEDVFQEVERFFTSKGLTCFNWTPAVGQPLDTLGALLEREGYSATKSLAMMLDRPMQARNLPELEMVNAKLRPELYEAVFHLPGQRFSLYMAPIHLQRLRFLQYEVYTALLKGEPVGRIGLLSHGDIGRIKNVFVGGDHRRLGIASAMLSFVVNRCFQQGHRSICLEVDPDNTQAIRCYECFGFSTIGAIQAFMRR